MHDNDVNGYYDQAGKLYRIINALVFTALNAVMEARISYLFAQGEDEEIRHRIRRSMDFTMLLGFGGVFGKERRRPFRLCVQRDDDMDAKPQRPVQSAVMKLNEERDGWYEGTIDFKRVLLVPGTGKFQYRDTHFVAQVRAISGIDCYNRIVEHLRQRVDDRSQFPSAKGKNFSFRYLGMAKNQY